MTKCDCCKLQRLERKIETLEKENAQIRNILELKEKHVKALLDFNSFLEKKISNHERNELGGSDIQ